MLLDHYDDDWSQLWWVRVRGRAVVHDAGDPAATPALDALVAKYEQYREHAAGRRRLPRRHGRAAVVAVAG